MPGRRPKPEGLRLLEGNRGNKRVRKNPKPLNVLPDPPKTLDRTGRKEWRERGRELFDLGLLTILDLPAFEVYCDLFSQFIHCGDPLKEPGFEELSPAKKADIRKEIRLNMSYLSKELRAFAVEFGMTPASRSRLDIKTVNPRQSSSLENILNSSKNGSE